MNRNKLLTISLLLIFAALAIGWDSYVYIYGEDADMISNLIWNVSASHPVVPFLSGFLMGHFFWGKGNKTE